MANRWLRAQWALLSGAFFMDFCLSMILLGVQNMGVYILDAPNVVLGLLPTAFSLCYASSCLFSGGLSDRLGRKRLAMTCCVLQFVWWCLMPLAPSWPFLAMLMVAMGLSLSLYWPSLQAWLAEVVHEQQGSLSRVVGLFNIAWCVGMILGPLTTGTFWSIQWRVSFWLPVTVMLLLFVILASTPEPDHDRASRLGGGVPGPDARADRDEAAVFLTMARIGNFCTWFGGGVMLAVFPKLSATLAISTVAVGWAFASFRGGQLCVSLATRYTRSWQYRVWPLVLLEAGALSGMLIAAVSGHIGLFACAFLLLGACVGLTYASSLFYSLADGVSGRGRMSGIHEAILGSGGMLGPIISGILAQWVHIRAPFVMAACLFGLAIGIQLSLHRRFRLRASRHIAPRQSAGQA